MGTELWAPRLMLLRDFQSTLVTQTGWTVAQLLFSAITQLWQLNCKTPLIPNFHCARLRHGKPRICPIWPMKEWFLSFHGLIRGQDGNGKTGPTMRKQSLCITWEHGRDATAGEPPEQCLEAWKPKLAIQKQTWMDSHAPKLSTSWKHTEQEWPQSKGDPGNRMRYNSWWVQMGKGCIGPQRVTFTNGLWIKYGINVTFSDFASHAVVMKKI